MINVQDQDFKTIHKIAEFINWDDFSVKVALTEDIIREFADQLSWSLISWKQTLSEDFIREFAERVNWYWILRGQQISEEFVLQHLSYFVDYKELWRDLPSWCREKGWNYQRLTEAREMVGLLA